MRYSFFVCALCLGGLSLGCKPAEQPPANVTQATVGEVSTEKSEVELSEPKLIFVPPELLKFEFKYKFVKGKPTKNYVCMLSFPGSNNQGQKPMEAWELQASGTIKGGIELQSFDPPVKAFEITMGEAEVPQSGYETISNKLTGEVTYPEAAK
ncbi:MAG: hypothetical protein IT423_14330 [Pirellulaceae bacterium]|nr:hypothetical protein [Pirellulaceae bacterium]